LAIFFVALWCPPNGMPEWATASWMFACLVGVRLFDTLFELPHMALVPELARETHRRTSLFTVRYLAESISGIAVTALAYNYFLRERADGTGGVLAADGYGPFALFCGAVILVCILACARGLQSPVMALPASHVPGRETLREQMRHVVTTLHSRSFLLLAAFAILVSIGSGMGSTLSMYWLLYYYRFSQAEMSLLFVPILLGILLTALTPAIARRLGKANAAILFCWTYFAAAALPLLARASGWIAPASNEMLVLVAAQSAAGAATMTMVMIVLTSMVSDLTEEAERRTGRRSEALLLASMSFVRKATQGLGALGAGIILTVVAFPVGAERTDVGGPVLDDMAALYLGGKAVLFALATLLLRSSPPDERDRAWRD
jgi:glycoside/pentoside/hexuronide:cation symporter, GPH family